MVTFFMIILALLVINASLLIFSTSGSRAKSDQANENLSDRNTSKIYPLDLSTSKYKKAI